MDEKLQQLMQELGEAINESLSDSDRIAAAIGVIKKAGYNLFLVLECSIVFSRRDDASGPEPHQTPAAGSRGRPRYTSQDHKFMKGLRISLGEEPPKNQQGK